MGILTLLLILILGGWIYRSWRSLSELKQAPSLDLIHSSFRQGRVSILIPAKNEENNIAACVRPLLQELQKGDELIVINNGSTDRTELILKELGAQEIEESFLEKANSHREEPHGGDVAISLTKSEIASPTARNDLMRNDASRNDKTRFRYLNTPPTPEGWTGKNFALDLGAQHASGDWLLFTDADTRHEPGSINAVLSFAEEKKLDLLTLLPRCIARGFFENLLQPCAMSYMGLWFPIRKINDPKSEVYFGNGQYLLLDAGHYRKTGGHKGVKEAFLEDFALMEKTKKMGARGMCAFGMEIFGTRMYDSWETIWRGWRRIFLHAFGQKPALILKRAVSVFFFSVFPLIALMTCRGPFSFSLLICALILVFVFLAAMTAYSIIKARKFFAILHPFAALIFTAILLDAFQTALFKRATLWR